MMQNSLSTLADHIGVMNSRITKLESSLFSRLSTNGHVKSDPLSDDGLKAMSCHSSVTDAGPENHYRSGDATRDQSRLPVNMTAEDEIEAEPGPPVPPGRACDPHQPHHAGWAAPLMAAH